MKAYWTIKDGRQVYAIQECPIPGLPNAPWCVYFTPQGFIGLVEGELAKGHSHCSSPRRHIGQVQGFRMIMSYRMLLLAAVALSAATAQAQDRQVLPGWGPFKFGMSRDAIISDMGNRVTRARVGSRLGYDMEINGAPYSASLVFDDNLRLSEIHVEQEDVKNLEESACVVRIDEVEDALRKRYGSPDINKEAREQVPGYKTKTCIRFQSGNLLMGLISRLIC